MASKSSKPTIDVAFPLRDALATVEPKPVVSASREEKHSYASRLSRELAKLMARALRPRFPEILPTEDDKGHESPTWGATGKKRLDVKVWDVDRGLLLLVSIKTYSFKDWHAKKGMASRYTKNIKRNRFELQDEAVTIHRRQPFAVMVAVMFMPFSACEDGDPNKSTGASGLSSFAHAVGVLRSQAGRLNYDDPAERFERIYIALYEYDDEATRGRVEFFDVTQPPPRAGRPASTRPMDEIVDDIEGLVYARNTDVIEWGVSLDDLETEASLEAGEDAEDDS